MREFEDTVRAAMHAHAGQAPTATDLLVRLANAEEPAAAAAVPARRRSAVLDRSALSGSARLSRPSTHAGPSGWTRAWPVLAAACVALVAGVGIVIAAQHRSRPAPVTRPGPTGSLACPSTAGGETPRVPSAPRGVDGSTRLVPVQVPTTAVICAWKGANISTRFTFAGRRVLHGSLRGIPSDLRWAPRLSPKVSRLDGEVAGPQVDYLLGLTYPSGTIWVATASEPNDILVTTNGIFGTAYGFAATAATSFAAGSWTHAAPPPSASDPCGGWSSGRFGQESHMVPAEPVSVTICASRTKTAARQIKTVTAGVGRIAAALNATPATPMRGGCRGRVSRDYLLTFHYRQGPAVVVDVEAGCRPEVSNASVQSGGAAGLPSLLEASLRH